MEEFNTYEKALALFTSVGGNGAYNNIFIAFKDTTSNAGLYGGAVGAFAAGMVNGMKYPFDGLLINQTEKGIGMFYLKQPKKMALTYKMSDMVLEKENFIFISSDNIKKIEVKKFALLNSKKKKVTIETNDEKKYKLVVSVDEKLIPYHSEYFARFMDKCKNGKIEQDGISAQASANNTQIPSNTSQPVINTSQPANNIQQTNIDTNNVVKNEQNLINNNQEKEKFANMALNFLIVNHIISDYNGIECEYGYLYLIEDHGYEGLFKIKKLGNVYYFAMHGNSLEMVNLDENSFELHKQTFLNMHS